MTLSDDQAVNLLTEMLRTPSLCGHEDQIATLLLGAMREAGFEAARDEAGNVIGSLTPRPTRYTGRVRCVSILGHMDTVAGFIPVERHDGALYGRGAVDAKGPLATAIVAASRAAAEACVRITVIGAVQEEGPSVGARAIADQPAPDYLIIAEPSGWDAVVMGYKGSQRFTARITCPSGHSAGPESTAPERAITFWNDLVGWCGSQSSPAKHSGTDQFNSLTPTLIGMSSDGDGLYDTATLRIGLRLPLGLTCESVRSGVRELLPDGELHFAPGEEAVRGSKSGPLVAGFLRSIRAEGGTPRFKVKTGTSDMNVVGPAWGCPMLAYGPGDSRLDHTPHEHIEIDEYLRAIRVLTAVLKEL